MFHYMRVLTNDFCKTLFWISRDSYSAEKFRTMVCFAETSTGYERVISKSNFQDLGFPSVEMVRKEINKKYFSPIHE